MTEKAQMKIAFIGLGRMGGPIAGHLAAAGHNLTVVEPNLDTLSRWCQNHEGTSAPTAEAAASDAEVVITSLPADAQLQAVAEGILDHLPSGGVWVDHTTASVQISRTLARDASTRDLGFIDAPVSGGVDGATHGTSPSWQEARQPISIEYARCLSATPSASATWAMQVLAN